ncbi:MAG: hypothetical protein R3228_11475 [Halioglobus sp.]|nr:hypothetical protein [Halioglobus sp.]
MKTRTIALFLSLLLYPATAFTLVVDKDVAYGLPKNTIVEIVIDEETSAVAETDDDGKAVFLFTDGGDRDDDDNTFDIPAGTEGTFELRDVKTGKKLDDLKISGGVITVASLVAPAGAAMPASNNRTLVEFGVINVYDDSLKQGTADGARAAVMDGYTISKQRADDDAGGIAAAVTYSHSLAGNWNMQGALAVETSFRAAFLEDTKGIFWASVPGQTLSSSGERDTRLFGFHVGPAYTVVDNVTLIATVGYDWYDTETSTSIFRVQDGAVFSEDSQSSTDGTTTFSFGARYACDDWFARLAYTISTDNIDKDKPESLMVTLGRAF